MAGSRPEGPEPDENERGSRQHGSPSHPPRAVQRESEREGQGTRQVLITHYLLCMCVYNTMPYCKNTLARLLNFMYMYLARYVIVMGSVSKVSF